MLKQMFEDMAAHVPESGYNVVAVDDYEVPGEQLFLVSHHEVKAEAEEAAKRFGRQSGLDTYVYGPAEAEA